MAIRIVDELKHEETGVAACSAGGRVVEGAFHKCGETGDVEVQLDESVEGTAKLVLDDGGNSTYFGTIGPDGVFSVG